MKHISLNSLKVLPAFIVGAFASSAGASGFQLLEQNASGIGNAYAGSAALAENASIVFYNPAGMTQLKDREFSFGVTAIKPEFEFHDNGSSVGTLGTTSDGGNAGSWGFVPNLYLSWKLNEKLYAGLGIGAPFGLMTEYDSPWKGSAQSNKFEIKTYNINPSLAWKVSDTISLGAGLNWQKLEAEYQRQVAVAAVVPPGIPGDTPLKLGLDDESWGWNVGALIKLSPVTNLGLSYRSKTEYSTTGNISGGSANSAINAAVSSNVKADVDFPDTFIASVSHQLDDRWQLLGDVSWTGWSSIPKIDIIRTSGASAGTVAQTLDTDFQDTWRVALGTNYQYSEAWKLKFGIAYDQSPVKGAATRLTSLPDNDRIWFSVGAQWKTSQSSRLDFGLTYLYLRDAEINNNQTAQGRGTVTGNYKDSGWITGIQYSQSF